MAYSYIRVEREECASIVTLNRPEKRNALSLGMMRELIGFLDETAPDRGVRAVILAAEGKVFSAGHDISEMTASSESALEELFATCTRLMLKLHEIPQPVIAEVQGLATAAGCQLVAACDLAIASREARFATPGVRIGLFCSTPMVPLTRAIGRKRAMQMLLTGEAAEARTAEAWGLINRTVEPAELRNASLEMVRVIAQYSAETIATGKHAFYEQVDQTEREAYERVTNVMTENALAGDAQEGMSAFLEKRQPVWGSRSTDR